MKTLDPRLEFARSRPNLVPMHVFGKKSAVSAASLPDDIWAADGVFIPPTQSLVRRSQSTGLDEGLLLSSGTVTDGSNAQLLVDSSASFLTDGLAANDVILFDSVMYLGHVVSVDSETQISFTLQVVDPFQYPLLISGFRANIGDAYRVCRGVAGAFVFLVVGLDGDYLPVSEFVISAQFGTVATVNSYFRVNRYIAVAVIDIINNTALTRLVPINDMETFLGYIPLGEGVSYSAMFTVPRGTNAYITSYFGDLDSSSLAGTGCSISLMEHLPAGLSGVFNSMAKSTISVSTDGKPHSSHDFNPYLKFGARTDIFLRVNSVSVGATVAVSGGFTIILEKE